MPQHLFLGILYTYSGCRCNYAGLAQATQAVVRLTFLGLYVMYAQAAQSVCPVESTVSLPNRSC